MNRKSMNFRGVLGVYSLVLAALLAASPASMAYDVVTVNKDLRNAIVGHARDADTGEGLGNVLVEAYESSVVFTEKRSLSVTAEIPYDEWLVLGDWGQFRFTERGLVTYTSISLDLDQGDYEEVACQLVHPDGTVITVMMGTTPTHRDPDWSTAYRYAWNFTQPYQDLRALNDKQVQGDWQIRFRRLHENPGAIPRIRVMQLRLGVIKPVASKLTSEYGKYVLDENIYDYTPYKICATKPGFDMNPSKVELTYPGKVTKPGWPPTEYNQIIINLDFTATANLKLSFGDMPLENEAGLTIIPPIEVFVTSRDGDPVTDYPRTVTLQVTPVGDSPAATLSGTATKTTVDGVATFDDLVVDQVGTYTLTASALRCQEAQSDPLQVKAAGEVLDTITGYVRFNPYYGGFAAEGVRMAASTPLGELVAEAVTEGNGKYSLSVPWRRSYVITAQDQLVYPTSREGQAGGEVDKFWLARKIYGWVSYPGKAGIPDVDVEVVNGDYDFHETVKTNADGAYECVAPWLTDSERYQVTPQLDDPVLYPASASVQLKASSNCLVNFSAKWLEVTSPAENSRCAPESELTVRWGAWNNGAGVDIQLSTNDGATWQALATGTENDGEETVTIPFVRGQGLLRVSLAGEDVADHSQVIPLTFEWDHCYISGIVYDRDGGRLGNVTVKAETPTRVYGTDVTSSAGYYVISVRMWPQDTADLRVWASLSPLTFSPSPHYVGRNEIVENDDIIRDFQQTNQDPSCHVYPESYQNEQTSPDGAVLTFDASRSGDNDGDALTFTLYDLDYNVLAGPTTNETFTALMPPGLTYYRSKAEDGRGGVGWNIFHVVVADRTPPTIAAPADVVTYGGENVDLGTPTVSDAADPSPTVTNDAPDTFPLGETTVTWTATDASGHSATDTQRVTVTTLPTLGFTSAAQDVPESVGRAIVTAQLSKVPIRDVTFTFLVGGTASNGDDYSVPLDWWRVTIPAGELSGDIPIDIVDDSAGGPDETVVVSLYSVTNATKGAVVEHTITIVNDDPTADPTQSLLSGRVTDGDGPRGVSSVLITATPQSGPSLTTVTDDGGYYCFPSIEPGTYTVTASKTWSSFTPGPGSGEPAPVVTVPPAQHEVNFQRNAQVMGSPMIAVEYPNGGEEWEIGSVQPLVWYGFDIDSNVKIELSRDGGATYSVLFDNTVNDGQEYWGVTGPATNQARIRISTLDGSVSDVSEANFTISDVEPPVITAPPDVTAEQTGPDGAAVAIGQATATDNADPNPAVTSDAPPVFPPGETVVTWTATDASGNTASATQKVTVADTTAPEILSVSATPDVLWPANHKMVEVRVSAAVSDICDAAPAWSIVAVGCNEPANGQGDGNTSDDWQILDSNTVLLRAERSGGGDGRVYAILIRAVDASGNTSEATVCVTVPHDQGGDDCDPCDGKGKGKGKGNGKK